MANALIGANRDDLHEVEFLVDTGSLYTFLTPELASALGIDLPLISTVILADQRTKQVPVGVAYLSLAGREGGIILAVMNVPMPLLGATALEILGLKVNPVEETLESTRPFGPAALKTFACKLFVDASGGL
jgi:predicted aspartyl protease